MLDALIDEYLKKGGTITRCPTVFLESSINARDLDNGMGSRESLEGLPLRHRARKARDIALSKAKGIASEKKRKEGPTSRELQARAERAERLKEAKQRELGKLLAMYNRGEPLEFIAKERGCSVHRLRELLRQGGVVFPKAPKAPPKERVGKGGTNNGHRFEKIPVDPRFREMVEAGMTASAMAEALGRAKRTIARWRAECGFPPSKRAGKKKGSGVPAQYQLEMVALYQSGTISSKIARKFGYAKTTVLDVLKQHNVVLKPRGINTDRIIDDAFRKMLADEYAKGDKRSSEIARKHGCAKATVVRSARMFGVPIRMPGPNSLTRGE